jgi:uracil phosphoribosyltransferase
MLIIYKNKYFKTIGKKMLILDPMIATGGSMNAAIKIAI